MKMSERGLQLLKQWEGFRNKVYADSGGKDTIGVGHLVTPAEHASGTVMINGHAVNWHDGLNDDQVLALLKQDVAVYEQAVNNDVTIALQQNQFDALVSFAFNEGTHSLQTSTLLKDINTHDMADVPNQFRRWNKVNGQASQGLTNRRENEIKLWSGQLGDTAPAASPPAQASPTQVTSGLRSYTVVPGDTLASVAAVFNTTVAAIADANNIINPADFTAGRVIQVPSGS